MANDIDEILIKVLQGNALPEEKNILENWLEQDSSNRDVFHSLQQYWHQQKTTNQELTLSKNEIWESRLNRYKEQKRNVDWRPFHVAAVLLIMILAGGYFFKDNILPLEQASQIEKVVMTSKSTTAGAKLETILPDGSLVKLNSESSLRYPVNFNDSIRQVFLEGEAYFEVKHNPDKPFVVTSQNVKTFVLGTQFMVSAYAEDDNIRVALATGKVKTQAVKNVNQSINILNPGEYIKYTKNNIEKGLFDEKEVFGWKEGFLFFKNNSYAQAIAKLERWFGVEFIYEGKQPRWKLNGEYQNESLESILAAISYSQNFEYEFLNDKLIKIKSK